MTRSSRALLGAALLAVGCGGGKATPPVDSVSLAPANPSILAGATVQLAATARDAAGNTVSGAAVSWATSDAAVATVSGAGLVTGVAPGTATITATAEGKGGSAALEVVDPARIPALSMPMPAGDYRTANFFDHDIPQEFVDANGRYLSFWGEDSLMGIDGHSGYDWQMDTGTPILAAAAGTVTVAGNSASFFCPFLNQTTSNPVVIVQHALPGGVKITTQYVHLSRIDVTVNQQVTEGQQLGLAGGVGCALNPHLHFQVNRLTETKTGQAAPIDPYGWTGSGPDPWQAHAQGAASISLWKEGQAPALFRSVVLPLNPNPGDNLFVAITKVRFQGVRDDQAPNNEFVEVTRDGRFAPASLDLGGFTIKNKAGDVFTFPAGATLTAANPSIKVFTGAGSPSASQLFWGQSAPRLDNKVECVKFFNAAASLRNQANIGGGCS